MDIIEPTKKVNMKRVRVSNIRKKRGSSEERENDIMDPRDTTLPKNEDLMLVPAIALVESDRNVNVEHYLHNILRRIKNIRVVKHKWERSISLEVEQNPNYPIKPYAYTVKRLESYGDLGMKVWAKRIKRYNETYIESMKKYFAAIENNRLAMLQEFKKASLRAETLRRNIEENYTFHRGTLFFGKEYADICNFAYSDKFLEQMGYTVESLTAWSKDHGIPQMLEPTCNINLNFAKGFLELLVSDWSSVKQETEFVTKIVGVDGQKRTIKLKSIGIVEPRENGLLLDIYYVLDDFGATTLEGYHIGTTEKIPLKLCKNC